MAKVGAVHMVGESIVGMLNQRRALLAKAGTLAPVPATHDIAHVPVAKLVSNALPTSGLSLTCYHIGRSNHAPAIASSGMRAERVSISLELQYLLACWSGTASDETALMSWAMMELNRFATLGRGQLLGDVWERDEVIQLAPGDEAPEQLARIWDGFKAKYRLSATYRARVVRLEYGTGEDALPVTASRFSFADGDVALEPSS
ncbi:DUF4255 domain-containing protein [Novosphingobium beihaiensis]|uniref:DUF4255 domain-containing protein n=1 Tax=Novosphingobium beihaiensis TaxID=2930389 RepID=A0ABT0BN64_9SPHN|nr:DUF4255 domain-containing protein [Novosphingobium beihaiensis]MCJ2186486.1 DUF4255 domain-containing protein [Novosphingobium beihaiensis]